MSKKWTEDQDEICILTYRQMFRKGNPVQYTFAEQRIIVFH